MDKFQISNFKFQISDKSIFAIKNWKLGIRNSLQGFTLVEMLMASGLLVLLIGVMTGIFTAAIDTSLDSASTSGVDQDGRYILAKLSYDMQRADDIIVPAAPSATINPTMTLRINSIDYIYSLSGDGNLELTNDLGTNSLNGYTTRIDNLSFQRIGIGDTADTIQVKFRLTSKIQEKSGSETKNFQSTIGIK